MGDLLDAYARAQRDLEGRGREVLAVADHLSRIAVDAFRSKLQVGLIEEVANRRPGVEVALEVRLAEPGEPADRRVECVDQRRELMGQRRTDLVARLDAGSGRQFKLVANLPYSVASPILVELAQAGRGPRRMVVTLQIEVAKRLQAKPGAPDYGLLTLLVQLDYEPQSWFKIPASCFFPEPDVDSACACLVRREQPRLLPEQRDTFKRIVKRSFSQRRKMMLKLLKEDWPEPRLVAEFERLRLSPQIRAEEVPLEQFALMAQALCRDSK